MIKYSLFRTRPCAFVVEASNLHGAEPNLPRKSVSTSIPSSSKRGKDSKYKLEEIIRYRPLMEKTRNGIADYCTTLEGDNCYSCWKAYLEFSDLEEKLLKKDMERMICEENTWEGLIERIHSMSSMIKGLSSVPKGEKSAVGLTTPKDVEEEKVRLCPIPDGFPRSPEEIEEEEKGRLPDSSFTKLLRVIGRSTVQYRRREELSWLL